jgi:hypothetical protein
MIKKQDQNDRAKHTVNKILKKDHNAKCASFFSFFSSFQQGQSNALKAFDCPLAVMNSEKDARNAQKVINSTQHTSQNQRVQIKTRQCPL